DAYLEENPQELSQEEREIVRSWKKFVRGDFYIKRLLKKYAVLALHDSFEDMLAFTRLPCYAKAVLLPFKNKIVYDGILQGYSISALLLGFFALAAAMMLRNAQQTMPVAPGSESGPQAVQLTVPPFTGYSGQMSYFAGDAIDFHISSPIVDNSYRLFVFREGETRELVHVQASGLPATVNIDLTDAEFGYDWPATATIPGSVTESWPSGYYLARIEAASVSDPPSDAWGEYIPFIIKPSLPSGQILVQLDTNTWQAYNNRFGRSYYTEPRTFKVCFHRPMRCFSAMVAWIEGATGETVTTRAGHYLRWLEQNGYQADVVANEDIRDNSILNTDNYRLFISVGHDEYWDHDMRDTLQAFIDGGGNALFFSSDSIYYQVRFEDNGHTMTSYKIPGHAERHDPMWGIDNSRVTTHWYLPPVNIPETSLVGLTYHLGGVGVGGYQIYYADDWAFENAGLRDGDVIGNYPDLGAQGDDILAREVDATEWEWNYSLGVPVVTNTAVTGTPENFKILAIQDDPTSDPSIMGYYTNTTGATLFHTGTWDWWKGLFLDDPMIVQITHNLLAHLTAGETSPSPVVRPEFTERSFRDGVDGYAGTQDTYLDLDVPDGNFAALDTLGLVHDRAGDKQAALVKFDLSDIEPGTQIVSAHLMLYGLNLSAGSELKVSKLLPSAQWQESQATWNQPTDQASWPHGSATIGASLENEFVRVTGRAISFELGQEVQNWVDDPAANRGIALRGYTAYDGNWGQTNLLFASSEHADESLRPELTVRTGTCVLFGDVDSDGQVTVLDIALVADHWDSSTGAPGSNYDPRFDLDDDGDVDVVDIALVAGQWGEACSITNSSRRQSQS
ncbi:MAG: DUF6605 domain-containing protein, partial [Chloroflexota bacterium]|nr:DUF6605 domain-containing protein [Chloroflexota bacterium]